MSYRHDPELLSFISDKTDLPEKKIVEILNLAGEFSIELLSRGKSINLLNMFRIIPKYSKKELSIFERPEKIYNIYKTALKIRPKAVSYIKELGQKHGLFKDPT